MEVMGVGLDQLLPLVATGSTVLLMRFGFLLRQAEREPRRSLDGELLSWVGVCAAGVILPWLIGAWWIPGAGEFSWTASALWDAIWPLLLGLAAGAAVWAAAAAGKLPVWLRADGTSVQPGDLVVAEESAVLRAGRTGIRTADVTHRQLGRWGEGLGGAAADAAEGARRITAAVERRLVQWRASGAVILVLLTGAVVVLAWGWLW
ncbi:hypothetical protein [Nesterenkonia sp.]|uniref:hypothetical protein n=1 Tax=Nesterenkonia sp. TaxID=704201 RepID=UPI002611408E|nr:hypothetical protein [Nesterenkonia sp.]